MRRLAFVAALAFSLVPPALGASPQELVTEGNQFLAGGDTDGAISRFGEAQSLRPNSPEVDLDLGLAHYRKGEHDRAAEYFTSAAAKDGGRLASVARYNLGNARVRQGRPDDALEAYREALKADPGNDDARFNYELLERYLTEMKEQEEKRKEAEEEFKRRLDELLKEARQLFERQAEAVARTWATDAGSEGPLPAEEDFETLKGLAEEEKPFPDELASRIARALVKSRGSPQVATSDSADRRPVEASSHEELARVERDLAARARKAATEAATLAAAIRPPAKQTPQPQTPPQQEGAQGGPQGNPQVEEPPPEHPLVGKLERAGGALEEGGKAADRAAADLARASLPSAEPNEVVGLWRFARALGELTLPKEAFQRKERIRAQQAALIRDLWESFPDSRGELPGPEDRKAFWERVKAGETPPEEDRMPMARQAIAAQGAKGSKSGADGLASREATLAEEARALGWEMEAVAASSGGRSPVAVLAGMLRPAAEAMEEAEAALGASPPGAGNAERSAVLAFVRLSSAPTEMDALLAELRALLLDQAVRVLDTWKSDDRARGEVPTEEELEAAKDEIERAAKGEAEISPELEAKLGRLTSAVQASQGLEGGARAGGEAAKLQADLADRAFALAGDMKGLATSGRPGEMNPAAPMLEAAAKDVEHAKLRMEAAAMSLPSGFGPAEPEQARAVAALERALSKLAQGAGGSAGEENQQQGEQKEQQEKGEQDEGERKEGEEAEQDEKDEDSEEKERESVSKQQAERLLDEAAQEEREVRRDIRKRRGTGAVEVRRDW
jgi:tetratricopeptide (TPR) repeat protein